MLSFITASRRNVIPLESRNPAKDIVLSPVTAVWWMLTVATVSESRPLVVDLGAVKSSPQFVLLLQI